MLTRKIFLGFAVLSAGFIALTGCASMEKYTQLENELALKQNEIAALQADKEELEDTLASRQTEMEKRVQAAMERERSAQAAEARAQAMASQTPEVQEVLLPPNAKPGECYARVLVPPTYKVETEQMLKREASERLEVVPARYEWVEEQVLVKPASKRLEVIPAVYETETERVLVRPAHTVWKKGTGPMQRVDHATGEIVCLVEVPATYKTVTKRALKQPATTRTVEIPAEYRTIKVRKLVSEPEVRRIPVPAEYQTVSRRIQLTEERLEWRPILCRTNATPAVIMQIQRALQQAGHDPGAIDGIIGPQTMNALKSYQRAKGLAVGDFTFRTLESLGVSTTTS